MVNHGPGGRLAPVLMGVGLTSAFLIAAVGAAAQSGSFLDELLNREGFSATDRRALGAGLAVVKTLDTPVRQELAHFGVVHVGASTDRFIERFLDIERFERGPGIPQIGRFSNPPRLQDLSSLTVPEKDVTALSRCRPGNCDVKLPASAMIRFHQRVDWSSPTAALQANVIARELIVELVQAYQSKGNAALGSYDDDEEPLAVADEFRALLTSRDPLPLPVPELMTYLDDYPHRRPAGALDFFYWTVVDFGLKPTVRVNHVVIYPLPNRPSGVSHVIAIKQLYASHYFHTTLELRFLVEGGGAAGGGGFHLVSLTRSRSDGTTGFRGSLLRPIISRRSRTAVRGYLEHLKRQVERATPASF